VNSSITHTLIVFHHAGGSPASFISWRKHLSSRIRLVPVANPDQATQAVVAYLAEAIESRLDNLDLSGEPIVAESRFEDLGMDSITLVELALLIERDLSVVVTDEQLAGLATIGAAGRHIAGVIPDDSALRQLVDEGSTT
jgi:acyl carrier protein